MRSRSGRDIRQQRQADRIAAFDGVAGGRFVIAGLFSAKVKDVDAVMAALDETITSRGGSILGAFVQRRGISRGGKAAMSQPFSQRTLMTSGKIGEIAAACATLSPDAVVFVNPLTERQRHVLSLTFGCHALSQDDITPAAQ